MYLNISLLLQLYVIDLCWSMLCLICLILNLNLNVKIELNLKQKRIYQVYLNICFFFLIAN